MAEKTVYLYCTECGRTIPVTEAHYDTLQVLRRKVESICLNCFFMPDRKPAPPYGYDDNPGGHYSQATISRGKVAERDLQFQSSRRNSWQKRR